ncbi:hypothetical protein SAMN05421678_118142 [Actinopolymorpha cephalotaxi]|uniref:Uncharacterized protein n=1 Tax=Actinopolymorpha cephalotaxi TaxID=504797 RepID=A0A1I3AB52_9ACTN|nr:hypothetical protein SAMN05421678_118142 [Actinopolymorpha cephalotaxi]
MCVRTTCHPHVVDEAVENAARAALLGLWRDGSPVVRPKAIEKTIALGWRRWRTFGRRHAKRSGDFEAQVEDLAKGLRDAFEADRQLVGPLMEHYRFLARTLGAEFAQAH